MQTIVEMKNELLSTGSDPYNDNPRADEEWSKEYH